MGKTVRWLHLSDFHVGMDDYGQRKLFSNICDHIEGKAKKGYIPDFVFLTGDLANKGLAPEYSEFIDAFLYPMLECLGASWDGKVVAIPGNHDVDRARAPFLPREEILAKPQNAFDPTEKGQLAREQLALRFKNYSDMDVTGAPTRWLESKAGSYSFEINIRGCDVGVVAINTAWLSKDNNDRHLLTPGVHLLDDALGEIKNSRLKLVLGHHPLDWLEDNQAQQLRVLLGKHSALYLHGHLHANECRYDDGGQGAFLGIRCGSAFQGRPDDNPPWVNGLLWADVDLDKELIELQPLHWSAQYLEWKLTADAFSNQYESGNKWAFPLPGARRPVAVPLTTAPSAPRVQHPPEGLGPGWGLVDAQFLNTRMSEETEEGLLQFFDGRPPTWRLAQSAAVPPRGLVERLRSRFGHLDDAAKPAVVHLSGPSSEGKSTAFLQTVVKLVREDGWVALWRHNDLEQIDADTIRRLARNYPKLLVAVDEAHSLAPSLASLLTRLGTRPTPHFLLCSRSLDWRAEVREMGSITVASDYQEVIARGIDPPDAALIVAAWARLGKKGLGALEHVDGDAAVDALLSTSRELEGEEDEGALFGAMLKLRYGDKLKDRIRSILYRLNDMRARGRPILDAYAMIAAMHAEGLRFLSVPVLAEHFGVSESELHKRFIWPLADEAVAAGGGRFVLCRHKAIAEASVAVLRESNLSGELDSAFSELSRAATNARQKGIYIPDLHKWNYDLPTHFMRAGKTLIAVATSEQMQDADPDDLHLRVNLSKIYRESGQIDKAVWLFRNYAGDLSRVAWHEWAVGERWKQELFSSIMLAAISLCDIPATTPVIRTQGSKSANTIASNLTDLYHRYGDPHYLPTIVAAAKIAVASGPDDDGMILATETLEAAVQAGASDVPDSECLATLKAFIEFVLPLVDFDALSKGRIPRSAIGNFDGLGALVARQTARPTPIRGSLK